MNQHSGLSAECFFHTHIPRKEAISMPVQYTSTIQGDTWDMIAKRVYGNELLCDVLMQANPMHLNTVIFPAGIVLAVPETELTFRSAPPPWRAQ